MFHVLSMHHSLNSFKIEIRHMKTVYNYRLFHHQCVVVFFALDKHQRHMQCLVSMVYTEHKIPEPQLYDMFTKTNCSFMFRLQLWQFCFVAPIQSLFRGFTTECNSCCGSKHAKVIRTDIALWCLYWGGGNYGCVPTIIE